MRAFVLSCRGQQSSILFILFNNHPVLPLYEMCVQWRPWDKVEELSINHGKYREEFWAGPEY